MTTIVTSVRLKEVEDEDGNEIFELQYKEAELTIEEEGEEKIIKKTPKEEWTKADIV